MSTQDTADANYMLLTVVVNGHNCVAVDHNCCLNKRAWLQRRHTLP